MNEISSVKSSNFVRKDCRRHLRASEKSKRYKLQPIYMKEIHVALNNTAGTVITFSTRLPANGSYRSVGRHLLYFI